MPIESVYYGGTTEASAGANAEALSTELAMEALKKQLTERLVSMSPPRGIDALTLLAFTDQKESWYGAQIDKTKYRIVLEDETEDSVYLKLVKIQ